MPPPLDLARDIEGVVGIDGGGQQGLRQHALGEGLATPLVSDQDVEASRVAVIALERPRPQDRAQLGSDLGLGDDSPATKPMLHLLGRLVRILEADPARHERVDHDPAHERVASASAVDEEPLVDTPRGVRVRRSPALASSAHSPNLTQLHRGR
jgi:hypothetical protein